MQPATSHPTAGPSPPMDSTVKVRTRRIPSFLNLLLVKYFVLETRKLTDVSKLAQCDFTQYPQNIAEDLEIMASYHIIYGKDKYFVFMRN